ncbi:hypothetical protein [Segatella baroniae]|nr:hypothetical protein [Segatella baroniae]
MKGMVAGGYPWMAGGQTRPTVPEAFLRALKPAASPPAQLATGIS